SPPCDAPGRGKNARHRGGGGRAGGRGRAERAGGGGADRGGRLRRKYRSEKVRRADSLARRLLLPPIAFERVSRLGLLDRMRLVDVLLVSRHLGQPSKVDVQDVKLLLRQVLDRDQSIARALQRRDQLVELELNRERI